MHHDVEIQISVAVNPDEMSWPKEGPAAIGEATNRMYVDLSTVSWDDVAAVIEEEEVLVRRCIRDVSEDESLEDLLGEAADDFSLCGLLDLGTASATYALNAEGCPTITSCSGHETGYPYVAFWARLHHVATLSRVARAAGVGLGNARHGALEIFALPGDVESLLRFARGLLAHAVRSAH